MRALKVLFIIGLAVPVVLGRMIPSNDDIGKVDIVTSVPRSMTYQGILKNADGEGIPDRFFDVTFRIFDAESDGTQLWSQAINVGTDANGMFKTELDNLNIPFDEDYWLELEVGGEILDPRQKLNMVGYAATADTADYAVDAQHATNSDNATHAVDATSLDGHSGSYYLDWDNLDNVPPDFADGIDDNSGGDITEVMAGSGLSGGGYSGSVTISIETEGITSSHLGPNSVGSGEIMENAVGNSEIV